MSSKAEERRKFKFEGFEGFDSPNTTPVPDVFFDLLAPALTEAELRVLLYIIRRIYGFKKEGDADNISLKQLVDGITTRDGRVLDHGAGVAKSAAVRAVKGLVDKSLILATRNSSPERGDQPTTYTLRFRKQHQDGGVFSKRTRGSPPKGQGGVLQEDTQETVLQQTVRQQTESSNYLEGLTTHKQEDNTLSKNRFENFEFLEAEEGGEVEDDKNAGDYQPLTPANNGFRSVGQLIRRRGGTAVGAGKARAPRPEPQATPSNRGRPPKAPEWLARLVRDTSEQLHDHDHVEQNIGQAARLWKQTGYEDERFAGKWSEARRITQGYTVAKPCQDHPTLLNRMPYFFKVLRDLFGLKDVPIPRSRGGRYASP